jgi:hypothetical protein
MAGNEKQFDNNKPHQRPDILRAKDIIPGAGRNEIEDEGGNDIPRFDLAKDIMAEHRRLTATRRKSPSRLPIADYRLPSEISKKFRGLCPGNPSDFTGPIDTERSDPRLQLSRAGEPVSENRKSEIENQKSISSIEFASQWDPIIADIVTRDIESFCGGRL